MVHPRPTSTMLREYSGIPSLSPLLVGPARGGKERVMAVSLLVDPDEAGCVQPSNGTTSPWLNHGEDRTVVAAGTGRRTGRIRIPVLAKFRSTN